MEPTSSDHVALSIARQEATLERMLEWIRAIDSKTPIILGLCTAMLAVLGAVAPKPNALDKSSAFLLLCGGTPLVLALIQCMRATFPQTRGPANSLLFFGGVAATPYATYDTKVNSRSEAEYLTDLNAQCHRNAEIAAAKFRAVQWAFRWLYIGMPLWLVACYLLS